MTLSRSLARSQSPDWERTWLSNLRFAKRHQKRTREARESASARTSAPHAVPSHYCDSRCSNRRFADIRIPNQEIGNERKMRGWTPRNQRFEVSLEAPLSLVLLRAFAASREFFCVTRSREGAKSDPKLHWSAGSVKMVVFPQ